MADTMAATSTPGGEAIPAAAAEAAGGGGGGDESPLVASMAPSPAVEATSAAASAAEQQQQAKKWPQQRAFGRSQSVHQLLGGGKVADMLLWRDARASALVLSGALALWAVFEVLRFTLLEMMAYSAMLAVGVIFLWAQTAALLNWSPPPVPELVLSEATVAGAARAVRRDVNAALAAAHDAALGKSYTLFGQTMVALYVLSVVGSRVNFLTFLLLTLVLAFTVPIAYERNDERVDAVLSKAEGKVQELYRHAQRSLEQLMAKVRTKHRTGTAAGGSRDSAKERTAVHGDADGTKEE